MEKGIIFARVSTKRQEKEGLSLREIQLPALKKYAQKKSIKVVYEFVISETADQKNRKAFNEMLKILRAHEDIKHILTYTEDRLTRNSRDVAEIETLRLEHGKEVHFVFNGYSIHKDSKGPDVMRWDMAVFMAKQYLNRLRDHAKDSYKTILEERRWPSEPPYGYVHKLVNGKKLLTPVEGQANFIKMTFELYSTGNLTVEQLCNILNERGYQGKYGAKARPSTITHNLNNKIYYGELIYAGKSWGMGIHKPLVGKKLFDKCQEVLAKHNQHVTRKRVHDMLLRGFLFGNKTKVQYWGYPSKKQQYWYYVDQSIKPQKCIAASELEEQVEKIFSGIQITENYKQELLDLARVILKNYKYQSSADLAILSRQREKVLVRRENNDDDRTDKKITLEQYQRVDKKCADQLTKLNDQITSISEVNRKKVMDYVNCLVSMTEDVGEAYRTADNEIKKAYLELFIAKLFVEGDQIISVEPSNIFQPLIGTKVLVGENWLSGPV